MRVLFSPHSHPTFIVFLMLAILTDVKWYLFVVLICTSLMISSIDHIFICMLAISISSLEAHLFSSTFYLGCLIFFVFMLNCMSCLYMLDVNPLLVISFANIFSHSVDFLFVVGFLCYAEAFKFS